MVKLGDNMEKLEDNTTKLEVSATPKLADDFKLDNFELQNSGLPVIDNQVQAVADEIKIENGNKMKIRCEKCNLEDTLTEEDSKLLAHVVKRYNPNPLPEDYTAVLSIIKGRCADGDKHLFSFDESFDKIVTETIKEYHDAISANVARKETLEKISLLICETNSQIKSLGSNLLELEKKKEHVIAEMSAGGLLVDNIKLKFMKLTGTEDISIWE